MRSGSIAKNTMFMTAASVGQKVLAFAYFTLIARNIGAEGTGKYFFALSFTTIFVVFVDMGLTNVLIREAAKLKQKTQQYISTVLSAKIWFGVFTYLAAVLVINLMGYPAETRHLVYLSAVTMLFDSIHLSFYGVLRAYGQLRYEAISIVASQLLTFGLGSIFLLLDFPLIFLILAFTIPSALNAIYAGAVLYKKRNIRPVPAWDKQTFFFLGKIAAPFAIAAIFARVYSYIDSVLLSKLAGDIAVGWYSIPYKITYAFQFFPLALVAAVYPRFSEYFVHDRAKLAYVFEQAMVYLLLIAVPIAIGIAVLAPDIIISLYTAEYTPSILPLRILIMSLIFSYISFPIGAFLNACSRQVTQTVIVGIVMVVNVILNVLLIPHYTVIGASIAAFVGNVLLTVLGIFFVPRIVRLSYNYLLKKILGIFFAAFVMGVAVWFMNLWAHFTIAIVVGAVLYPFIILLTRTITVAQLREARRLIRH